jgi:mannose-6-phosphate isomerase-like protein (cupin superfamily)
MAKLFRRGDARELALPGRKSSEIVSATGGADKVSFRIVEIAPAEPGETPRGPHVHYTFEECIYVLAGEGVMETPDARLPIEAGDTLLVPAGERHVTRNTGSEPLRLLCFFPIGEVASGTEEFPDWDQPKAAS